MFEEGIEERCHRRNIGYRMNYRYRIGSTLVFLYLLFSNLQFSFSFTSTTTTSPTSTGRILQTTDTSLKTTPTTTTATIISSTVTTRRTTSGISQTTTATRPTSTTPPLTTSPTTTTATNPSSTATTRPTSTTAPLTTSPTTTTATNPSSTATNRPTSTATTSAAETTQPATTEVPPLTSIPPSVKPTTFTSTSTTFTSTSTSFTYTTTTTESTATTTTPLSTTTSTEIIDCDALPCYPFGNCVDRVNDYSCICRPGFVYVSDQYCSEINECEQFQEQHPNETVCLNNGICQDMINGFYCECKQIYEDLIVVGERCEMTVSRHTQPSFTGISKNYGIQAGGSAITFNGNGLNTIQPIGAYFNAAAYGLGQLFGYLQNGSVQPTSFVVLTPKAPNDSYAGLPLTISVLLSGGIIQSLPDSVTFTFVGNPSITNIEPKTQLASGGIKLTVQGSNLYAVGTPQMTATLKEYATQNETGNVTIITYPPQTCFGATAIQMTCQMPKFNLSNNPSNEAASTPNPSQSKRRKKRNLFSNLYSSFVQTSQRFYDTLVWKPMKPTVSGTRVPQLFFSDGRLLKRSRRDSSISNHKPVSSFTVGNKTYELYLNFTLDNYPKYEDLSKSNITLTMIDSRPQFNAGDNEEQQNFDPSKQEPLTIKGSKLETGLSEADYTVAVGAGSCNITGLNDNLITCSPPEIRPEDGDDTPLYCSNYPDHQAIMITAAYDKYFAYCLQYSREESEIFLIIGLCVAIGGTLLLLIAVIVSVVIARRRRRYKKPRRSTVNQFNEPLPLHSIGRTNGSVSSDYFNNDYNSHIMGYDNSIDAGGATQYSRVDAAYNHRHGASEGATSSVTNIRRAPKTKPFGYFVRPGKRISWTKPNMEESFQEPRQRQKQGKEVKSKQNRLNNRPKLHLSRSASKDHQYKYSNDDPNMKNYLPSGSRNFNEEVDLDDGEDLQRSRNHEGNPSTKYLNNNPKIHRPIYSAVRHDLARDLALEVAPHRESHPDTWTTEQRRDNDGRGPFSVDINPGYSRAIDEQIDDPYNAGMRSPPERRREDPANDRTKIRRGNVNTYYPPDYD